MALFLMRKASGKTPRNQMKLKTLFVRSACLAVVLCLSACMAGAHLIPAPTSPEDLQGTYTVILYGCRHPADLENMAILVDESTGYPFEVYALPSLYKVKNGLPAPEALAEATTFINCSFYPVWQTVLRKVSDNTGKTMGYELKPLYRPWEIGTGETLLTSYILKDGKVTVYLSPDPTRENQDRIGNHGGGSDPSEL
jgi:hypothetical protein